MATRDSRITPPQTKNVLRISHLARVYGLIWAAAGRLTLVWAILLVIQGLLPVAFVYLTKPLVDGVQAALGHGVSWLTVQPVVVVAVALGVTLLLRELVKVALEWVGAAQAELVQDHLNDLLHAKSTSVDFAFYETPDFYDRMYRARSDATTVPSRCWKAAAAWYRMASPSSRWLRCYFATGPGYHRCSS